MSIRWPFLITITIILSLLVVCTKPQEESHVTITVVSYGGGAYQQSHIKAFFTPYEALTGNKINSVVWNADYSKLKAMVQSDRVIWDVVEVTEAGYKRGVKEELFEKLTQKPLKEKFLPDTISDFGVANVYWGTVLAFKPTAFYNDQPKNWKDFWDINKYPGPRALYDDPRGNLEFALLADGVKIENLYPLDIERAFSKLDQIKPYIRVWWKDGTHPIQLLETNSVVLTSAWNGRIFAAIKEGKNISYSWEQAALELDWWVIPRGSKHVKTASRFIAFASLSTFMAKQAEMIGYGPVNTSSLLLIPENIKIHLPTHPKNFKKAFIINSTWWAKHEEEMKKRWIRWKMK
jgi:putative spermidine/putrescine transport system substrate-binding protein